MTDYVNGTWIYDGKEIHYEKTESGNYHIFLPNIEHLITLTKEGFNKYIKSHY